MITIQTGDDAYRLVETDGDEGELVEYGLPALMDASDGCLYMCYVEDPDTCSTERLGMRLYKLVPVESIIEEVDFGNEDADDADDPDADDPDDPDDPDNPDEEE
jgi:hypothetical protein